MELVLVVESVEDLVVEILVGWALVLVLNASVLQHRPAPRRRAEDSIFGLFS